MAVALEGAKPLAVAATLAAFRAWAILRGLMLALLAVAAIAFSLTSELALIGGTRSDLAAKRASVVERNETRRARLQDVRSELSSLAQSRPVAEIETDVAKLLADNPRAGDCHVMDGPVSRSVCPQVAALNGEIARTQRRGELQADIVKLTDAMPATAPVGAADPASSALSTYLAVFGVHIPASAIAEWLVLIPVLALELGAALAAVLVGAVGAGSPRTIGRSLLRQVSAKQDSGVSNAAASTDNPNVSGHRAGVPQKAVGRRRGRPMPTDRGRGQTASAGQNGGANRGRGQGRRRTC
jgi:hypothetical protein